MSQTAREIAWQYQCDWGDSASQLRFVRSSIDISDDGVATLNSSLKHYGFLPLPERPPNPYGRKEPYRSAEAAALFDVVKELGTSIWKRQYALEGENVKAMGNQSKSTWGDITEAEVKSTLTLFPRNLPTDEELGVIRKSLEANVQGKVDEAGQPIDVEHVMRVARHRKRYNEVRELQGLWGKVKTLQSAAESHHPSRQANLYRQSFILLLTHFDATVFDLVRMALKKNFFSLAPIFGEEESVAFEKFGQHSDFESLRDELIDDLLRSRYVKELLLELKRIGVSLPGTEFGGFPRLIEIVNRRNIHLHNRGVVDARYLGTAKKPAWNLDRLAPGDYAPIGEEYLVNASNACGSFIDLLANWVDAGANPTIK